MGRHRSRLQIIADILSSVRKDSKKTRIMYGANLSYRVFNRYLKDVLSYGFMVSEGLDCYRLTEKGERFLRQYGEYAELCNKIEKMLNLSEEERLALEGMCSGGRASDADSEFPIPSRGLRKGQRGGHRF